MGSKTYNGVRFAAYPDDHYPPHVHAFYGDIEVLLDLIFAERFIRLSRRKDSIRPANAKRSDISHIRQIATENFDILVRLWQEAHP